MKKIDVDKRFEKFEKGIFSSRIVRTKYESNKVGNQIKKF